LLRRKFFCIIHPEGRMAFFSGPPTMTQNRQFMKYADYQKGAERSAHRLAEAKLEPVRRAALCWARFTAF
jgi:hypothetical protein